MCRMVIEACKAGNEQVIADVKRLATYRKGQVPETAEDLCHQIFHTVYMVGHSHRIGQLEKPRT